MLFIDEICWSGNQLNNGKVGGELFTVPKVNSESGVPMGATTDVHYNVPSLIFGTWGSCPVCYNIQEWSSNEQNPISWKTGIDITADIEDEVVEMHHEGDYLFLLRKNHLLLLWHICKYHHYPFDWNAYVSWQSESLWPKVCAIHSFSLMVTTLEWYVINKESKWFICFGSKWFICFGVPYATYLWQVIKASRLNGAFILEATKAKCACITQRDVLKF